MRKKHHNQFIYLYFIKSVKSIFFIQIAITFKTCFFGILPGTEFISLQLLILEKIQVCINMYLYTTLTRYMILKFGRTEYLQLLYFWISSSNWSHTFVNFCNFVYILLPRYMWLNFGKSVLSSSIFKFLVRSLAIILSLFCARNPK